MKRKTLYIRHHNFKVLKSNYLKAEEAISVHSIVIIFSKVYTIQPNNNIRNIQRRG